MVVYASQLLAVARLLGVTVEDIVKDAALRERIAQFFEEISR